MLLAVQAQVRTDAFSGARLKLEELIAALLKGKGRTAHDLEGLITSEGRELHRQVLEAALKEHGIGDVGAAVEAENGDTHMAKRTRDRTHGSSFGDVKIERQSYEKNGASSLFPLDAQLNLPNGKYSYLVQETVCTEVARGSYEEAIQALERNMGVKMSKDTAETIALLSSRDFDAFYAQAEVPTDLQGKVLVMSIDGAGIVVKAADLREATRLAAEKEKEEPKKRRIKPGEKRNRKRRVTVATVYLTEADPRKADDIIPLLGAETQESPGKKRSKPTFKRTWAQLEDSLSQVVDRVFEQAERIDPNHVLPWVAVVDGDRGQIRAIEKAAKKHSVNVDVIVDVYHVSEYIWEAAAPIYGTGSNIGEYWAKLMTYRVLQGDVASVIAELEVAASKLSEDASKAVLAAAQYLGNASEYLRYDDFMAAGYPIGSGVIEGACKNLVRHRMDRSGARWSLSGAEAVLKLRALFLNGDLDAYWEFHRAQELERNHLSRYAEPDSIIDNEQETGTETRLRLIDGGLP